MKASVFNVFHLLFPTLAMQQEKKEKAPRDKRTDYAVVAPQQLQPCFRVCVCSPRLRVRLQYTSSCLTHNKPLVMRT